MNEVTAGSDVIVLWASKGCPDTFVWMANAPPGVRVAFVAPDALATAVPAALVRGAVIAVVDGDRDAHRALALGVDEVVRASDATGDALSSASVVARLRAIARDARAPSRTDEEHHAIELLAVSVGYRLANPLAVASLNLEVLRAAIDALPPTSDLDATVHDLAGALQEATTAVARVCSILSGDGLDGACDLTVVVSEVGELVRVVVERVADFRIELPKESTCSTTVPRSVVIHALSALLTNAVHAVCDCHERGTIALRLEPRASAAILEVKDNGVGLPPAAPGRVLEPLVPTRREPGSCLSNVAERIRGHGGEIVLESETGIGTTARLFVPLYSSAAAPSAISN